jgi:hypothetical protein
MVAAPGGSTVSAVRGKKYQPQERRCRHSPASCVRHALRVHGRMNAVHAPAWDYVRAAGATAHVRFPSDRARAEDAARELPNLPLEDALSSWHPWQPCGRVLYPLSPRELAESSPSGVDDVDVASAHKRDPVTIG